MFLSNMRRAVAVIDIIVIIITIILLIYNELNSGYGLAALTAVARSMFILIALGIEVLILVTLCIIKIVEKWSDKK